MCFRGLAPLITSEGDVFLQGPEERPLRHDAYPHRATSPASRGRKKLRPPAPLAGEVDRRR
ncbi:hypothetical protein CSW59_19790 [Caulobacter sp. BP25]|nr:hypothetical protein CSW59_19790 [Caulobacter sp. BP25]